MNFDLQNQTAVVTGASRGIGAAIFKELGAAGASVIGTATGETGEAAIVRAAKQGGFRGVARRYNASSADEAKSLVAFAEEHFGGTPDILVCNAAINADGLLMRMKDADWLRVIEANLNSMFYLSRALLSGMFKRRSGRIIGVSSVVASTGNAGQTNYCASKAGMEGFIRALAREAAPRGVTANALAPGFINTDMTEKLSVALREKYAATVPLGRFGEPADVAAAALFLASPAASYITGQTLHVNGGMYI